MISRTAIKYKRFLSIIVTRVKIRNLGRIPNDDRTYNMKRLYSINPLK